MKFTKKKTLTNFEVRLKRKDDSFINVLYSARFVTFNDEQVLLNIGKDITERKKDEQQIEYQAYLLSQVNDAVFGLDTNFRIKYWNNAAEEMYGYTQAEALGKNSMELLHPKYAPGERERIIDELEHQGISRTTITTEHKNGTEIIVEQNSTKITDNSGETAGYVVVYRDVTEGRRGEEEKEKLLEREQHLKEELQSSNEELLSTNEELQNQQNDLMNLNQALKTSEEKFFKAFHSNPAAMTLSDQQGRWIDVNESYSNLIGYSQKELIGHTSAELDIINTDERKNCITESQVTGSLKNAEFEIKTKSGEKRVVISSSELIQQGSKIGFISFIYDITERKKIEVEKQLLLDNVQADRDRLETLVNSISDEVWFADTNKKFTLANPSALKEFNMDSKGDIDVEELVMSLEVYSPDGSPRPANEAPPLRALKGEIIRNQEELVRTPATNELRYRQVSASPVKDRNGNILGSVSVVRDITEDRRAEDALRVSEERLRLAQTRGNVGIWDWNTVTDELSFTPELEQLYGLKPGTIKTYEDWRQLTHPDDITQIEAVRDDKIARNEPFDLEFRIFHKSGDIRWLSTRGGAIYDNEGIVERVLGINIDITNRKQMEQKLKGTLKKYGQVNRTLVALRHSSFAMMHATDEASYLDEVCNIIVEDCGYSMVWIGFTEKEGMKVRPVAYSGFEKDYLKKLNITYDDSEHGQGPTGTAIRTGKISICENMRTDSKFKPWREEAIKRGYASSIVLPLKSNENVFGALNIYSKETNPFSDEEKKLLKVLVDDISFGITSLRLKNAHEKAEEALRESLIDLERSNAELEQFAYISSHDLREPLRMITSFLQLLKRRYQDQLDEDANEFIGFAVDGAKRLDNMINDLLEYSRITNKKREITRVNFEQVLEEALINLKVPIEETDAVITHDPLPTIYGDEKSKVQLFQNIIGNAIKYKSQETPQIHISATEETDQYLFSITDNGIGISSDHLDRIFTIFQRLHTKEEYEGTGIGLAIAQKIVHQQGGEIWAKSELGKGTTFYFTIPVKR